MWTTVSVKFFGSRMYSSVFRCLLGDNHISIVTTFLRHLGDNILGTPAMFTFHHAVKTCWLSNKKVSDTWLKRSAIKTRTSRPRINTEARMCHVFCTS